MFNNEMLLMSKKKPLYTHKITVGEYIPSYTQYGFHDDSDTGKIDPEDIVYSSNTRSRIKSLLAFTRGIVTYLSLMESQPESNYLFIIRLDNFKGARVARSGDTLELLFKEEDVGKTIELYISQSPPPFDWTDIGIYL